MKHIVHIVYGFHIGGLEKLLVSTINKLGNEYRHTIICLTSASDISEQLTQPVEIICLNKAAGNDPSIYLKIYQHLKRLKPDITQTYNLATIEYQCIASLAKVPLRLHAEHGRDSYDPFGKVRKYRYLRKLCSLLIHRIIAVSDELYQWLLADVGLPPHKVVLVQNGIDTEYFRPQKDSPTPPNQLFTIGHVARLQTIKNQSLLIQAFHQACKSDPEFCNNSQLVIVGDGELRSQLELEAQNGPGRILFTGNQPKVRPYYAQFDLFALTSISEGIPLTLLESMAMGVPHIVSLVGGIGEVIQSGKTGLSFKSNDTGALTHSLLQLYRHKEQLTRMGTAARERIETTFSQHAMLEAYRTLYTQSH